MRFISIALIALLITACTQTASTDGTDLTLASGKKVTVFLDEQTVDEEKVLVIDYKMEAAPRRFADIDDEAEQIWQAVKPEAEKRGLSNALLKLRVPVPEKAEDGAKKYEGLLYEAEKIENGSWKLKKVN